MSAAALESGSSAIACAVVEYGEVMELTKVECGGGKPFASQRVSDGRNRHARGMASTAEEGTAIQDRLLTSRRIVCDAGSSQLLLNTASNVKAEGVFQGLRGHARSVAASSNRGTCNRVISLRAAQSSLRASSALHHDH